MLYVAPAMDMILPQTAAAPVVHFFIPAAVSGTYRIRYALQHL